MSAKRPPLRIELSTPVQFVKGVGPKLGDRLRSAGICTVEDLLDWYPRAYEDRRVARNIASLSPGELVSLRATVANVSQYTLGRSRRKVYDVTLKDDSGRVHCKYFRVPYRGYFERFPVGSSVRVIGRVILYRGQIEFHHPDLADDIPELLAEDDVIIPIYPETEGVNNRLLRKVIHSALDTFRTERLESTMETFPKRILEEYGLMGRFEALSMLHRPSKDEKPEALALFQSAAHRRIIFEEFFWLELFLATRKRGFTEQLGPRFKSLSESEAEFKEALGLLPFQLTGAQMKAVEQIFREASSSDGRRSIHRLIQGDVGSGKTVVALLSAWLASRSGYQTALMAPTEILAEQHARSARSLLGPMGLRVELLTGGPVNADKRKTLDRIAQHEADLVVGTHALIEENVNYKRLGLVIVDEQHRFGVHQRAQLKKKGPNGLSPHLLLMTATPIPRTLAMTVYGDLDVTLINELPKGRQPIQTRLGYESNRRQMLEFVRSQIEKGRQAYFVYPLVEESEKIDLKNAVTECEKLSAAFPTCRVGLLHGRMKNSEKDEAMLRFRSGEFQILVATTVIEVGVDVPNANVMIIEHSERFGLSQLHQLRGRVGRGAHKSFCILMIGHAVSEEARERLSIMEETTDGFVIAERDLEIRGPGEFMGTRQSGLPGFKMANLVRDQKILEAARKAAFDIVETDGDLRRVEHQRLKIELTRASSYRSLAGIG